MSKKATLNKKWHESDVGAASGAGDVVVPAAGRKMGIVMSSGASEGVQTPSFAAFSLPPPPSNSRPIARSHTSTPVHSVDDLLGLDFGSDVVASPTSLAPAKPKPTPPPTKPASRFETSPTHTAPPNAPSPTDSQKPPVARPAASQHTAAAPVASGDHTIPSAQVRAPSISSQGESPNSNRDCNFGISSEPTHVTYSTTPTAAAFPAVSVSPSYSSSLSSKSSASVTREPVFEHTIPSAQIRAPSITDTHVIVRNNVPKPAIIAAVPKQQQQQDLFSFDEPVASAPTEPPTTSDLLSSSDPTDDAQDFEPLAFTILPSHPLPHPSTPTAVAAAQPHDRKDLLNLLSAPVAACDAEPETYDDFGGGGMGSLLEMALQGVHQTSEDILGELSMLELGGKKKEVVAEKEREYVQGGGGFDVMEDLEDGFGMGSGVVSVAHVHAETTRQQHKVEAVSFDSIDVMDNPWG
ncbi:hypothetical protein HDU98_012050 [Podochytrium sp. JEL0797]|nr:hypothetical protein HDU98_012050 [Podochytrium sp. JEL0797]